MWRQRRAQHPGMHIYHYASYERTHLLTIAARHGVGEEAVDDLLRNNVLVDLYPIVRRAVRVGNHSYSLKKLEPLYMGDDEREGVANAADSITEYVRSRELLAAGQTRMPRPPCSRTSRATTPTTAAPRCGCATGCWIGRGRRQWTWQWTWRRAAISCSTCRSANPTRCICD